jgi:hypothetical protein
MIERLWVILVLAVVGVQLIHDDLIHEGVGGAYLGGLMIGLAALNLVKVWSELRKR